MIFFLILCAQIMEIITIKRRKTVNQDLYKPLKNTTNPIIAFFLLEKYKVFKRRRCQPIEQSLNCLWAETEKMKSNRILWAKGSSHLSSIYHVRIFQQPIEIQTKKPMNFSQRWKRNWGGSGLENPNSHIW